MVMSVSTSSPRDEESSVEIVNYHAKCNHEMGDCYLMVFGEM